MRIHVEMKPKSGSFVSDVVKAKDRKDLAEVLRNVPDTYELDWAAVYSNGRQIMFFELKELISALQYDKYE